MTADLQGCCVLLGWLTFSDIQHLSQRDQEAGESTGAFSTFEVFEGNCPLGQCSCKDPGGDTEVLKD